MAGKEFPRWYYPPEAGQPGKICYRKSDIPKGWTTKQAKPKETNAHDL